MIEWVIYQGKFLGRIKLNDNGTNKFVFIAKDLESLITLFSIDSTDEIETKSTGKIPYEKFQQDYLKKISAFYPTLEEWSLKDKSERNLQEIFDKYRNKKNIE